MILIVGLGNPGVKYKKTRHNLGFRVIDEFFQKNRDGSNFSDFKLKKKILAEISEGKIKNEKIILAKPQTFMNLSGKSVKLIIKNYHLNSAMAELTRHSNFKNLWVLHDDIDLLLGKIRISIGRGAAGHKGVESIIKELGAKNFIRFRIGIKPEQYHRLVCGTEKFVLQRFSKEEEKNIKEVIKKTVEAIEMAIKEGVEKAMAKFN